MQRWGESEKKVRSQEKSSSCAAKAQSIHKRGAVPETIYSMGSERIGIELLIIVPVKIQMKERGAESVLDSGRF